MTNLEQIIQKFRSELGGDFISTDVVGMDGISIAGGSLDPSFKANDTSARFAEVMKLATKISKKIEIGKVDENLVTTDKTYIVSRFLGDGSFYWLVVVTSNATLGSLRMLMNEYSEQIWEAIPHDIVIPPTITPEEKPEEAKQKEEKAADTKTKRNFWADATPEEVKKVEDKKDEGPLTAFKYP